MESILGGFVSETYFVKQRRKDNFTILDNTCIRDCNLSWKAKGVHTYLMSLPDDWKIHISEIVNHSCDGKAALYSAIQMLEQHGYIKKIRNRRKDGCFDNTVYQVFEVPEKNEADTDVHPHSDFPDVDNPDMDNPVLDNRTLLTTNILNTNIKKTKLTNYEASSKENVDRGVSESVFVKVIKDLFSGEYPFDKDFESAVKTNLSKREVDESNLESYLKYVFERTKVGNVQKSFEGLYRVLALSSSVVRDFKNSSLCKKSTESENLVIKESSIKRIKCLICGSEFEEFSYYCPKCTLSVDAIKGNDEKEIFVKKRLYEMTDEEKQNFDLARMQKLQSLGRQFFIGNEQEEFLKEYGILANQT